jgi:addiction module HigA family antidote
MLLLLKLETRGEQMVAPRKILRDEFLKPMNITAYRLGKDAKIPTSRLSAILRGKRSITPDTALKLARYFGNEPKFWLSIQNDYDLAKKERLIKSVLKTICPLKQEKIK